MYQLSGEDLDEVLGCCERLEMEGVVLKHRDGRYRPGRRSTDWRKVKCEGWRTGHAERPVKR